MAGADFVKIADRFNRKLLVRSTIALPLLYSSAWSGGDGRHVQTLAAVSCADTKVAFADGLNYELLVIAVVVVELANRTTIILAGEPVNVDIENLATVSSLDKVSTRAAEATSPASAKRRIQRCLQVRLTPDGLRYHRIVFGCPRASLRGAGLIE
jgi:hypothetical protein